MAICQNVNNTDFKSHCLLKYITAPFYHAPVYNQHQNMWQVPKTVKIIGEFGYNVDVIDYHQEQLQLPNKYHLLIDIYPQKHSVYKNCLTDDCIKVLYSTGSSPTWQNRQHALRVQALNDRRGVALQSKNLVLPFDDEIKTFDTIFLFGNRFTLETYGDLHFKKVFYIRNAAYPFPKIDLAKKSPNTFLYFTSGPQTLKGLDLLLEVFNRRKNIRLLVCSLFQYEQDFCAVYEKELFHSPNIQPIGFIDINSDLFKEIREICSFMVLPSCSEAAAGSVVTAMSAGLIPIVSRECGFEDDEVIHLHDCSIDCIAETLCTFSQKPVSWIQDQSMRIQEIYRAKYTPEHFPASFRAAMHGIWKKTTSKHKKFIIRPV